MVTAQRAMTRSNGALWKSADALPETQYVAALLNLTLGRDTESGISELRRVLERNGKLIRCHYRLARLQAA